MEKTWKIWNDNKFEFKKFCKSNDVGLNFFYNEIFHWDFSNTKCIYEMGGCILENNDLVVDLGSNVGFFTRYAAEKCKKVISIEGSPECFSCLVENTSDLSNIHFLNVNIVGENNKESNPYTNNKPPINITIQDIFDLYNIDYIDFLKVDIEGGEYSIFEDLNENYLQKIRKIAIETHDKTKNNKLISDITKSGKTLYFFDWYHGQEYPQTMFYFY